MSEHTPYTIWLRWGEDQQTYLAEVPELPNVEGSGKTYEEARASVLEAIRWWREMSSEGEPSPFSQMLMEDRPEPDGEEEPPPEC